MPTHEEELLQALLDTIVPMTSDDIYYRFMFYGEGGVGKTKLATDLGTKILYIESDPGGWVTLQNHPENMRKCTRMVYKGLSQLDALVMAWERGVPDIIQHDLIVVDTLSAIATLDLDTVFIKREKNNVDREFGAPSQPDYGVNTERVRRTITKLLSLPVNIVLTAHQREDEDRGRKFIRPSFTPKLRKDLERMCTLVAYMTAVLMENSNDEALYERRLQVHPTTTINAKSRIGGLPVVLVNPDMNKIVEDWINSGQKITEENAVVDIPEPIVDKDEPTGLEI